MNSKLLTVLAIGVLSVPLCAKELVMTKQLDFGKVTDEQTVVGIVKGFDTKGYEIKVRANQVMSVDLESDIVYFNIYSPNKNPEDDAMFEGRSQGHSFKKVLSKNGVYMIKVYLIDAEAEKDRKTIYKMHIGLK